MNLGTGVAFRIVSDDLEAIRADLADHCHGLFERAGHTAGARTSPSRTRCSLRPPAKLLAELEKDFRPRPLGISALALHRYLGGPWEPIARYAFRGA